MIVPTPARDILSPRPPRRACPPRRAGAGRPRAVCEDVPTLHSVVRGPGDQQVLRPALPGCGAGGVAEDAGNWLGAAAPTRVSDIVRGK